MVIVSYLSIGKNIFNIFNLFLLFILKIFIEIPILYEEQTESEIDILLINYLNNNKSVL